MNDSAVGLILKQTDYKDSDALITVLTMEYGKLTFVAKGIRKPSSKNAGRLLPYTKAEFLFDHRQDKTIFSLKNVSVCSIYLNLHQDIEAQTCASVISEVSDSLLLNGKESDLYQEIFQDVEKCFFLLDQKYDTNTVLSLFLADVMCLFGIMPEVDGCAVCGNKVVDTISIKDGGFLCSQCAKQEELFTYGKSDLKRFRMLVKGGLKHIDAIVQTECATSSDTKILIEMLRMHAGITVRSYNLFERLFSH